MKKYLCLSMCLLSMFCIKSAQIPQADCTPNENAAILSELPASQDDDGSTRGKKCCCPPSNCCTGLQCSQIINLLSGCRSTPIKTPGTIINPGVYCLANDVTGDFIIEASNVLFDLNGFTITGGISIPNTTAHTDIVIQNGTLQDTTGIASISISGDSADRHKNITVSNITINNSVQGGVRFDQCNNILISNVLVTGANPATGIGMLLTSVDFATIENTTISSCITGISCSFDCQQVFINNSIVYNCMSTGFNVGELCQVIGCISTNNETGFICQGGPGVIANCSALQNTGDGIQIINGNWEVLNCQANSNNGDGILVASSPSTNIIIKLCQVAYNFGDGIFLNPLTNGSVESCSAIGNTGTGFNDLLAGATVVNYVSNFASSNGTDYSTLPAAFDPTTALLANSYWRNTTGL